LQRVRVAALLAVSLFGEAPPLLIAKAELMGETRPSKLSQAIGISVYVLGSSF